MEHRKKIILITSLLTIVIMVAGFFLVRNFRKHITGDNGTRKLDFASCKTIPAGTEYQKDLCLKSGYAVWIERIQSQAYELKERKWCDAITQVDEKQECLLGLSALVPSEELCNSLTDDNYKQACLQNITVNNHDFSGCRSINEPIERGYCFERVMNSSGGNKLDFCNMLSAEDKNECLEIYYIQTAVSRNDYVMCGKIATDAGRKRCLERMPLDTDGDQISDYLEVSLYGSNPNIADTDGDGFSDGVEIKSNHDPLNK